MKCALYLAIACLVTCSTSAVIAGDADSEDEFGSDKWAAKNCAEPQGEQAETVCVAYEYRQVDAKLNEVYKKLKALTAAGERGRLVADERAWIKQRDATCKAEVGPYEENMGTAHLLFSGQMNSCLAHSTAIRLKVLQAKLNALSR
jgi:uncharacterized protein YecT (DUF1311 family)